MQGQTPPKRADVGNGVGGQFTVSYDGAAEGGRGLLAASLGDTATTTENAQQPTQTQPRKKLGSVIFAPLQKIHIQIITDAICIVIVVAWLAVFVCFGLLFLFCVCCLCLCLCLLIYVCVCVWCLLYVFIVPEQYAFY